MSQVFGELHPVACRPRAVAVGAGALKRPVPIGAVEIQQQVSLPGHGVVPEGGRALDPGLDNGRRAAGARPVPEQPVRRRLHEDGLARLVLHEAQEALPVAARDGQDVQVDDVGRGLVDVRLWRGEGVEVRRVRVADLDIGCR